VSSETEAWQANSLEEVEFGIFKNFLYKNSGGEVGNVCSLQATVKSIVVPLCRGVTLTPRKVRLCPGGIGCGVKKTLRFIEDWPLKARALHVNEVRGRLANHRLS